MKSLLSLSGMHYKDIFSSMVVFLVALPLCLGIAVASGAPPIAGLVGGIIGGIVVGLFGGSPLQVSGPANGLIVVSFAFISSHSFELLLWATLIAGVIQFLAGTFRFGQLFRAVTPGVILGLMLGFAVVIFFGQLHVLLGSVSRGSTVDNLMALREVFTHEWLVVEHSATAVVGLITIATIFAYERLVPARFRIMPPALAAVIAGTAIAQLLASSAPTITIPSDFLNSLNILNLSGWNQALSFEVFEVSLLIAFIASAETLLCCTAVDKLHEGPRTRYNRELSAQGLGNMLCGFFGGLPITGVIIRSSANVAAGAKTKYAAVLHGVWLLAAVLLFSSQLSKIPLAVLAAVLVHAVTKLVKKEQVLELWRQDRFGIAVLLGTAVGVVLLGVFQGVVIGLLLSATRLLKTFTHLEIRLLPSTDRPTKVSFQGSASFLRIPYMAEKLEQIEKGESVELDTHSLIHLDHAAYNLIRDWEFQHRANGGEVLGSIEDAFQKIGVNRLDFRRGVDLRSQQAQMS